MESFDNLLLEGLIYLLVEDRAAEGSEFLQDHVDADCLETDHQLAVHEVPLILVVGLDVLDEELKNFQAHHAEILVVLLLRK